MDTRTDIVNNKASQRPTEPLNVINQADGLAPMVQRDDAVQKIVGGRIRDVRIARNISREALAQDLGVSVAQVGFYETGKTEVPSDKLFMLSMIFAEPVDWFFIGLDRYSTQDLIEMAETERVQHSEVIKVLRPSNFKDKEQFRMIKTLILNLAAQLSPNVRL